MVLQSQKTGCVWKTLLANPVTTDEQFNILPNSTNAVESHNRLSELSKPEILYAAMLTQHNYY